MVFKNLEIYDLHEKAELGSELCGEYWDVLPLAFTGTGHFLQNSPYFYGYTGNRAHGIMSDWSEYTLSGEISIHDLKSDTGLIRGIGVYTSTELTFDDDTTLSMSDFSAGIFALDSICNLRSGHIPRTELSLKLFCKFCIPNTFREHSENMIYFCFSGHELYETDTDVLSAPYNPSVAKPIHVIWAHYDSTALDTFYAKINGAPTMTEATCILGRDGTNTSDWMIEVNNEGCTQQTVNLLAASGHSAHSAHSNRNVQWMMGTMVIIAMLFAVWSQCGVNKKMVSETEVQPLLQSS